MKYQRREGTADGNDKYSIANQGGCCDDNNDNDDDDDNDEENDDEKYSKACLGGQNGNDNDDEEGAVILTRVTTDSQGDRYMAKAIGRVALGLMMQEGHCETAFAEINQNF